jgi:TPR repeat protein
MEIGRNSNRSFASDEEAQRAWDDARSLAMQGRWATALAIYMRLSDDGYAPVAYTVAHILERGPTDVPQDLAKAEEWYERAVTESDDPDARLRLAGVILRRRSEIKCPDDKSRVDYALHLLHELADGGNPYAALYLGRVYSEGKFLPRSFERAEHFFQKAADQEFVFAFVELSRIAFRTRRPLRAISLRVQAHLKVIRIMCSGLNDKRLFLVHPGIPSTEEKASGWHEPNLWMRLD